MELDSWAGAEGVASGVTGGLPIVPRNATDAANESKRDKRRREMAIKVERIRQETIERKDIIHADLQESYRVHLNAILSLPYPTHPEYLLRLHGLSVQRDADTLAARLESTYSLETARQLYHREVDRVEEEYESAKKAIKEKLLEACDERAKKLKEEKDSLELPSLEGGLYGDSGKHATRRRGVNGFSAASGIGGASAGGSAGASASTNGGYYHFIYIPSEVFTNLTWGIYTGISISGVALPPQAGDTAIAGGGSSNTVNGTTSTSNNHSLHANLSSSHISDPFNYSLLPNSPALAGNALHPSMLLLQPGSNALLQSLKTGHHYHHHRTTGGRTKAGYPPNGLIITPGTYAVLGKSITAINSLRAEEIADDVEHFTRRRIRARKQAGHRGAPY